MPSWLYHVLLGWIGMKIVLVPAFIAMRRALRATDEQDRLDAIWLAEYEARRGEGGDLIAARRHRPRPRSPRDGRAARTKRTSVR
jgi:hypothetical protein